MVPSVSCALRGCDPETGGVAAADSRSSLSDLCPEGHRNTSDSGRALCGLCPQFVILFFLLIVLVYLIVLMFAPASDVDMNKSL